MPEKADFLIERSAMDLLSDVLRDLHLESAVMSTADLRAPWGLDFEAIDAAPFHVVVEGRCLLALEGGEPVELAQGDLVVLPHGHRHALVSARGASCVPLKEVLGACADWVPGQRIEEMGRIRIDHGGALTRILGGVFVFRDRKRRNPLLEALPAALHVPAREGRPPIWLDASLRLLIDEAMTWKPGSQTVIERLADIVFVQAVRDHVARAPASSSGWLRGLTDPAIARALSLVHARPGEPWTVASLAKAVALSRTVFANRFRELVGTSVIEYVTGQRMQMAANLLAASKRSLPRIAAEVGYESEFSFSRAFRRWASLPPGQYRRAASSSRAAAGRSGAS